MDNSWVTQIEENVKTYVDAGLEDVYVTSDAFTGDTASFPAVYVHELSQSEVGYNIEGDVISGVRTTFQLDVYSNSYDECKTLSKDVMLLMKELRFEVIASPLHTQENGYYRSVSRYRRVVGGGDNDLITDDGQD